MNKSEQSLSNKLFFLCEILQPITYIIGALSILLPLLCWNQIPDIIPAYYGLSGIADRYTSKHGLLILLLITLSLLIIVSFTARHLKEEANSEFAREKEKRQMELEYPLTIYLAFLSQCCFAYIIYCSATCRNLGSWFTIISLLAVFVPMLFLFIKHYINKFF